MTPRNAMQGFIYHQHRLGWSAALTTKIDNDCLKQAKRTANLMFALWWISRDVNIHILPLNRVDGIGKICCYHRKIAALGRCKRIAKGMLTAVATGWREPLQRAFGAAGNIDLNIFQLGVLLTTGSRDVISICDYEIVRVSWLEEMLWYCFLVIVIFSSIFCQKYCYGMVIFFQGL